MSVKIQFYFLNEGPLAITCKNFKALFRIANEGKAFLKERDYDHVKGIGSKEFIQIIAYLSNIFSHLINLSVSMQGTT